MRKRCIFFFPVTLLAATLLCCSSAKAQLSAQNDWYYVLQSTCSNYLEVGLNDSPGDTGYTVQVLTQPLAGQATINGRFITYCPTVGYTGADQFKYVISKLAASDTATVFLNIRAFNNSIYPGDADQNGVVEHFDVLALGLGYNLTGPARTDSLSINALAWPPSSYLSSNPGAADCNGDGIVDDVDLASIRDFYGLTYPVGNSYNVDTSQVRGTGIPFYLLSLNNDTVSDGGFLDVMFMLGNAIGNTEAYGLAFTLEFDSRFILGDAVWFNTGSSWLLQNNAGLFHKASFQNRGEIEVALTRTDHQSGSGTGPVLIGRLPIDDNIDGIIEAPGWHQLNLKLKKVRLINPYNITEDVSVLQPNVQVLKNATGITQPVTGTVKIYPNPVADKLMVTGTGITGIQVNDLTGRAVFSQTYNGAGTVVISCSQAGIANGAYLVTVKTSTGTIINKLIVEH